MDLYILTHNHNHILRPPQESYCRNLDPYFLFVVISEEIELFFISTECYVGFLASVLVRKQINSEHLTGTLMMLS